MAASADPSIEKMIEQCQDYENQGEMALVWQCAHQALEQARALADRQGQALALLQIARIEYLQGLSVAAAAHAEEALAVAAPETPEVVRAWLIKGNSAVHQNALDKAEADYRQALDFARRFGTPSQRVICLHDLANGIFLLHGQFDLALSYELEAHRLCSQYDLNQQQYLTYITLSRIYLAIGRFEAARSLLAEWQRRRPVSEGEYGYRCLAAAHLALADGELEPAADLYQQSLARAEMYGEPGWLMEVYLGMSRCLRQMNNQARALEWSCLALKLGQANASDETTGLALIERARAVWMGRAPGNPTWKAGAVQVIFDLRAAMSSLERAGCACERARAALLLAAALQQEAPEQAGDAFLQAGQLIHAGGYLFLLDQERELAYPLLAGYLNHPDPSTAALADRLLEALSRFPPLPLRIRTLGGLSLRVGAHSLGYADLRSRRAGELLALLLSSPGFSLTAEQAAEALVPESGVEAGRTVIYKAASELRRALEPDLPDRRFPSRYLEAADGRLTLRLPPGSQLDFKLFEESVAHGSWEQAAALYAGDYLPEYRYAEWAVWQREDLAQDFQTVLLRLAELRRQAGEWPQALELARRLLALDHWNEPAALIAMQAYQNMGDRAAALRIYRRLEKALQKELLLEPGEDLQQLARSLKRGG